MSETNRNLLVMFRQSVMTPEAMEHQVCLLHAILYKIENFESFAIAHEIIDLNKYKIYSRQFQLKKYIKEKLNVPFVFLNNKN